MRDAREHVVDLDRQLLPLARPDDRETLVLTGDWRDADTCAVMAPLHRYAVVRCPPMVRALQRTVGRRRAAWLLIGVGGEEKGLEVLVRAAQMSCPDLSLAILGPTDDPARCQRWLNRGCLVYLDASSTAEQVFRALRLAREMKWVVVDQRVWKGLRRDRVQPLTDLTRRERQVMQLVGRGLRNSDIALELGLAKSTVEFHVGNVLQKLAARNRAEAVHRAVELGL